MDSTLSEKSVKLPTFDGSHATFQLWWTRFKAYATVYKFDQALKVGGERDLPASESVTIDTSTDVGKRQEAAKKRNAVAMANLTMAFTTEATMGLVYKAMSNDWPGGLAHEVTAALLKKYKPEDTISRVELRQKMSEVRMKKNDDPATLFEQLSAIENQYNTATQQIDEEDMIATVISAAPTEYKPTVSAEQRLKGNQLKLQDLEEAMSQYWRQSGNSMRKTNEDDYEVGLSAFKGKCYKCQKFGHKASDCKTKIKFKGNCSNCGKQGHKAVDCWEKEENKDKRPKGFKPQREKAAAATDSGDTDSRVEFLLYGSPELSFPDVQELLDDPNVWIGDTAATVDMTPYKEGMTNLRIASKDDGIAMGNGQIVKTIEIGEIRGTICDKHGNKLNRVRMTEVQYLPKMKYNLFSLTKRMNGGWKLISESEKIRLKKGNQEVTFDIKIPTPKGAVYAMYLSRENEIGGSATEVGTKMMIQQVHERLGHCGEEATRKTAKELGWTLNVRNT